MAKYIIEMPEDMFSFGKADCGKCPNRDCPGWDEVREYCPIVNAKKAVEVACQIDNLSGGKVHVHKLKA